MQCLMKIARKAFGRNSKGNMSDSMKRQKIEPNEAHPPMKQGFLVGNAEGGPLMIYEYGGGK